MLKLRITELLVIALVLAFGTVKLVLAQDENNINIYDERRFKRYMSNVETCLTCHGSYNPIVRRPADPRHSLWINSELFMQSAHAMLGCQACHTNIDAFGHRAGSVDLAERSCAPCHRVEEERTQQGIAEGLAEMQKTVGIDYNFTVALTACINCHPDQYAEYRESTHGVSVFEHQNKGAPFCIECHGIHYILPAEHRLSQTNPEHPSTRLRATESQIRIQAELTRDIGISFEESFHGKRGELGGSAVAVCSNCHGTHAIYAPDDPRSRVNMSRIAKTCGECHEGAQLNFATAFTHKTVSPQEQLGLYILADLHVGDLPADRPVRVVHDPRPVPPFSPSPGATAGGGGRAGGGRCAGLPAQAAPARLRALQRPPPHPAFLHGFPVHDAGDHRLADALSRAAGLQDLQLAGRRGRSSGHPASHLRRDAGPGQRLPHRVPGRHVFPGQAQPGDAARLD
jgi:hypothetical protein